MIFHDILTALELGRSPVVITERKDHLQTIAERLAKFAKNVVVLKGGMKRRSANEQPRPSSRSPTVRSA